MQQHLPGQCSSICSGILAIDQTSVAFAPLFGGFVLETLGLDGEARNAIRECIQNSLTAVAMDDEIGIPPVCGPWATMPAEG